MDDLKKESVKILLNKIDVHIEWVLFLKDKLNEEFCTNDNLDGQARALRHAKILISEHFSLVGNDQQTKRSN